VLSGSTGAGDAEHGAGHRHARARSLLAGATIAVLAILINHADR
jgi:hypothetical protein